MSELSPNGRLREAESRWLENAFLQLFILLPSVFVFGWPWLYIVSSPIVEPTPGHLQACWPEALGFLTLGAVFGFVLARNRPDFRRGGRWVWVFPGLVIGWLWARGMSAEYFLKYFFHTDGADNQVYWILYMTLPTVSAIGHSFAMFIAHRIAGRLQR